MCWSFLVFADDPKMSSMGVMGQCGTLHNEEHIYATATTPGKFPVKKQTPEKLNIISINP